LLAGCLLLILPTVLIGIVAIQRFSALTATTTELSQRDLPEIVTMDHLRTLLYQELDAVQTAERDATARAARLKQLTAERATLLALEPPDTSDVQANDTVLVRRLIDGLVRTNALMQRSQALIAGGQTAQARAVDQRQLMPLLETLIAATGRLRSLEDKEAIAAATQVQQQSSTATHFVLALTLLVVPLSLLLALLLTRSLTRPLGALLRATKALAAGDLDASPRVRSRDEIGQVAGAFDTMRSSLRTTISALALERQQTQAIIDACADGMILVDGHQQVLQMNPAAEQLTGWRAAEAIGQPCWTVCGCRAELSGTLHRSWHAEQSTGDAQRRVQALCEHLGDQDGQEHFQRCSRCPRVILARAIDETFSQELLVRLKDGQERWLAVSCAPIPADDGPRGRQFVVSLHDITQLKALDQLKTDFVAMVSHELRAPVTTVAGAVEMLGQTEPSAADGSYHEVLTILEQQTQRLRTVVEEVLQVTRLEAGRLPVYLQSLPLVTFLRTLLERIRREWIEDERPVRLPEGDEVVVWADPAMLEIVLRNLLDNARKYTPAGSPLEVEVRTDPATHRVQVRLSDHGPGIPRDQLDHIFERFSRGSRPASQWTRGYGLGLYIARELLRAHNGEIWAENHADGARFVWTLCPADIGEASEPAALGAAR
jgi:signal transduction histidine kinase